MFKIEKDIPIPAKNYGGRSKYDKLLNDMAPGDSVLMNRSQANYFYMLGRKLKRQMIVRGEGDKKRVWYVGPMS